MRLVPASLDPPPGLADFLHEIGDGENGFLGSGFASGTASLAEYLRSLVDMSGGRGLRPEWVPMTTHWLLDTAGDVVGVSRLRHWLTPALLEHGGHIGYYVRPSQRGKGYGALLLKLTLQAARELGIEGPYLLTVDSANVASVKVIEANSGRLEDERLDSAGSPYGRYWIE